MEIGVARRFIYGGGFDLPIVPVTEDRCGS